MCAEVPYAMTYLDLWHLSGSRVLKEAGAGMNYCCCGVASVTSWQGNDRNSKQTKNVAALYPSFLVSPLRHLFVEPNNKPARITKCPGLPTPKRF